ncbi:MAG: MBL fold metallo-hydrolase [Patescibacteria group bacterium]|nr:MBL fold metallo-hydrolase [Patescibacteria group bacterium]
MSGDRASRLTFVTGVGTVTGANFLLETPAGSKVLVDCGMVQGEKVAQKENAEAFPYDLASVSALVVTHAHLDHVGRIPKLVKDGYRGPIYSTPQTLELGRLVLEDAVGIIADEARRNGTEPLYSAEDVARIFPQWKTVGYHEKLSVAADVSVYLKDAGHILGSAMVEATVAGGPKVLFTGDLGNSPHPLLRDTEPVGDVDYMVMESVYGDRNHESRDDRTSKLRSAIDETMKKGGTLVIPSFALDRSQVLLYELNMLVREGKAPSVPVFFDSPMAEKATAVYAASTGLFNDAAKAKIAAGDKLFSFPHLKFVEDQRESRAIDGLKQAKIIMAGAGMSVGGRVINHELHYLSDPKSTILLVGYQSPGSLGRELADGAKKVRIHGEEVEVKAAVETLYGFSAHKDSDHLVEFVSTATDRLKQVFVAMGEPGASMHLAQRLNDELGAHAVVPERGTAYTLEA